MNSSRELKPSSAYDSKPISSSTSCRKKNDISINRQPFANSKNTKSDKTKVNSVEQKMVQILLHSGLLALTSTPKNHRGTKILRRR